MAVYEHCHGTDFHKLLVYERIYLFLTYLTTFSVTQNIQHEISGFMNKKLERMRQKAEWSNYTYCPGINL
jgi:hypothetical protein